MFDFHIPIISDVVKVVEKGAAAVGNAVAGAATAVGSAVAGAASAVGHAVGDAASAVAHVATAAVHEVAKPVLSLAHFVHHNVVEPVAHAVTTVAHAAADVVSKGADAIGSAASDAVDWIGDHASDIGDAALTIGKGLVTAYTGPLGGLIFGAVEGGAETAIKGGDLGDVAHGAALGGIDGATGANPLLAPVGGFAHDVDANLQKGESFDAALAHAAQNQDLDALGRAADAFGGGPLYSAGTEAGIAALQGEDAAGIIGAGVGGGVDGWIGGTVTGDAIAGGVGGLTEGLIEGKSGSELLEKIGEGSWEELKESNPGLALGGEVAESLIEGKPLDEAILELGEKHLGEGLEQLGVDKDTAGWIAENAGDLYQGIAEGKSVEEILADKALGEGGEAIKNIELPPAASEMIEQLGAIEQLAQEPDSMLEMLREEGGPITEIVETVANDFDQVVPQQEFAEALADFEHMAA